MEPFDRVCGASALPLVGRQPGEGEELSPGHFVRAAQQAARDAERRFPVRVKIAVPPEGLGSRLDQIIAWLDANCGADGWTSTPSSTRGIVNDALTVYFLDATIASAFVARGVRHRGSRFSMGCIRSAMTSRHRGLERACIRRPERHQCSSFPRTLARAVIRTMWWGRVSSPGVSGA